MKKLPISVCLISGPEAQRIGAALQGVAGWASEVIVVLNEGVVDGTEEIAREHGARVFRESWKGHVAQKNSAADKATQPWLFGLDADEVVSPELRAEIERTLADEVKVARYSAFSVPRRSFYCGRWIRHGDWYPDRKTRLWKKGWARWGGIDPHDRLEVQGATGKLRADLLHYSNESINRQVTKIVPFSDAFVQHALAQGRHASVFDLTARPFWRFVRAYLLRLGFLDGWPGYYIACLTAFSTLTRYTKMREAQLPKASPP
jgi:glycosyltransferase involved in cell wall biosynthesis